ncbi:hypothetical protein BDV93DRAFT_508620 [Ceratobasidium sp. AG-I]|nr:hypothetical protein BDV93DRAFT_508620 [Ceratobasidium sp. AG-I]
MVTNRKFGELLHSQQFCSQFRYFSVDEAHLVIEWADFRSAFLDIQRLRNRFSEEVVWLALTATAEPTREFGQLVKLLGFRLTETTVLRLPVDRKTITYASRYLQHTSSDTEFLDLAWVIPLAATRAHEIPITVIFADKIDQVDRIIAYLTRLLPSTIEKRARHQTIQPVSGIMSIEHNTQAVESVRSGGDTRVLVCTDTGALGIDLPQVQQVAILVEKGASYRMLCQKMGRIRTGGLAILYFHRWMSFTRTGATDTGQREGVEPVILDFANSSVERCPRAVNISYWGDPHEPFDDKDRPCCNIHSPEVDKNHLGEVAARLAKAKATKKASVISIRSDRTHKPPDELVLQPIIQKMIYEWRRLNLRHIQGYETHMPYSVILPESLVDRLSKKLHLCTDIERFRTVMGRWSRLEECGESLFELVEKIWGVLESEEVAGIIQSAQDKKKSERQARATAVEENTTSPPNHVTATLIQQSRQTTSKRPKPRAKSRKASTKTAKKR